ncbi:PA0069 family radical SAM protein [Methylobacillus glycogenes]|uniref:PA0069 family radical SAM protein n=1 Tax=Methylobacillus glycogenes TaxID=406 RepID=UPI000A8C3AA0|nr:PA0069 family radical SAM protein [Methylobacillus glycogenes]
MIDSTRTIINWNDSPDIPFDRSINPYRGCEHGCIYCFARPSHTYLGFSAGLDFERRILIKPEAAKLLRAELSKKNYRCGVMAMGTNTDPYQPLEKQQQLTRQILTLLAEFKHPVSIVTKSAMVERDIDILAPMAEQGLAQVLVSVTTLSNQISRTLEPRAAAPQRRLQTIRRLHEAGIPVGVMVAPIIPVLTDTEMENILTAARDAGAETAGYVLLRLPLEVSPLFEEWLQHHYPLKAAHVMSIVRQSREGKTNQAEFHARMRGSGLFADMIRQRFRLTSKRLGLNQCNLEMNTDLFQVPGQAEQLNLF